MGKPPALFINRKADFCSGIKKKGRKRRSNGFCKPVVKNIKTEKKQIPQLYFHLTASLLAEKNH